MVSFKLFFFLKKFLESVTKALCFWDSIRPKITHSVSLIHFQLALKKASKNIFIVHTKYTIYDSNRLLNPQQKKTKSELCFAVSSKIPFNYSHQVLTHFIARDLIHLSSSPFTKSFLITQPQLLQLSKHGGSHPLTPDPSVNCQIAKIHKWQSSQQFSTQLSTSRFISPILETNNLLPKSICWK